MPHYRLYHLDPHSGHIRSAEELFAADDETALQDLRQRHRAHPLELWQGARKVAHVDAPPEAAALDAGEPG
jgi:hypothetical protein